MEKVELQTADIAAENAAKLAELFPDIVTEVLDEDGNVHHSIDVEALKAHVGDIAEDKRERYQFTWPGKQRARAEAIRSISKTMRPAPEESVNWDTTENLYIEGDNLDALKILRETYTGKIKMIYIDPPYNTGHDFVYNDSFARSAEEERAESGAFDEEGNVLDAAYKVNNESNGKFHSDWCSMMYPRLVLARDLLSDDGAVFVSLDDNELTNCIKLGNEIFGENNYVACLTRKAMHTVRNSSKDFNKNTDYVLVWLCNRPYYDSDKHLWFRQRDDKASNYPYDDHDGKGPYKLDPIYARNYMKPYRFVFSNGLEWSAPQGSYPRYSVETLGRMDLAGELVFSETGNVSAKRYLARVQEGQPPDTLLRTEKVGFNSNGTKLLSSVLGIDKVFSQPKPVELLEYLLSLLPGDDSIVLDFFSGSATTAHAVIQLNAEDGGNRKFIMVQLPEVCDGKSEAAKAGYKNICEIGKERIRRAGAKIATEVEESNAQLKLGEEPKKVPDIGFRVFKIDSTNFEDVSRTPDTLFQDELFGLADNLKSDRTPEDILFELLPKFQIPYAACIERLDLCGKTAYSVDDDTLLACFDREVPEDVIRAMAEREPSWAVLRDASFVGDDALANFEEIFKSVSPDTKTRVV